MLVVASPQNSLDPLNPLNLLHFLSLVTSYQSLLVQPKSPFERSHL